MFFGIRRDVLLMYKLIITRHIRRKLTSMASSFGTEFTDEVATIAALIEMPSIIENDLRDRLGLSRG